MVKSFRCFGSYGLYRTRFLWLFLLLIVFLLFSSCIPQRPEPKSNDIFSWKMEILNSPGNVLIKEITGTLVYVSGSDGIIHDGKTGIYIYRGGFYSSDKGKKVTLTNVTGTLYRDSIQIDFSKGGNKTLSSDGITIEATQLNTIITTSDKDRALWDQRYVFANGYIKKGLSSTGDVMFSYKTSTGDFVEIPVSGSISGIDIPLAYDVEATLTGFTQFSSGKWKLNVINSEIGNALTGDGIFVDEIVDGITFKSLGSTYKLIGVDVSLTPDASTNLLNFVNEYNNFVQIVRKKTDEDGNIYVFLFSGDGWKMYQEEILKNGKARPDFDLSFEDPEYYRILADAYKQAYNKKVGPYETLAIASTLSTSTNADSYLNQYVIVNGTVLNVQRETNGNWLLNVDNWLEVIVESGNYKYLFQSDLDILKDKPVSFYGYLTKPENSDKYVIELKAEWEYFTFAGGKGTPEEPFLIESPLQLLSVRALATQGKYFRLISDI
ncbi:MAG: hypothetical protein ACK4MM_04170, partial [Fervidobacterium sp.]